MSVHERKNFIVRGKNTGFYCMHCSVDVQPHPTSVRNHCPACLWSLHVDSETPGDRQARCQGLMQPVGYRVTREGHDLEHKCQACGKISRNKNAPDDSLAVLLNLSAVTSS